MPDLDRMRALVAALRDPHVSHAWNACKELAKLGAEARVALPVLSELMRGRDATTVLWARYAVARITGETAKHLPVLVEALEDKRVFPGMAAAALAGFGPEAAGAVPRLTAQLADADADNRWGAAWALAQIGPGARDAVSALADALHNDPDEKTRWYAAFALGEIGPDSLPALPTLLAALDDPDDDARGYAARALGRLGPAARPALPRLEALLADDNPAVRAEAEAALKNLEPN